jgi:hypothetical protein
MLEEDDWELRLDPDDEELLRLELLLEELCPLDEEDALESWLLALEEEDERLEDDELFIEEEDELDLWLDEDELCDDPLEA